LSIDVLDIEPFLVVFVEFYIYIFTGKGES